MKKVYSSHKIINIHNIQALLDQYNIKYFITDEQMNNILPHYGLALGGIRIMVNDSDYEAAKKIVNDFLQEKEKSDEKFFRQPEDTLKCPNCHSENISVTKKPTKLLSLIISLFFLLPVPVNKKYYQCNECSSYWNIKQFSNSKLFFILVVFAVTFILIYTFSK